MRELSLANFGREAELSYSAPELALNFWSRSLYISRNRWLGNYAAIHHRKDILDYTSLAVEMGVLDSNSASEFLAAKHFIPGGVELGIYPKAWLIQDIVKNRACRQAISEPVRRSTEKIQ